MSTSSTSRIAEVTNTSKFNWTIRNFSKVNSQQGLTSEVFSVGSYQWRLRIHPKGYDGEYTQLAIFLVREDVTRRPKIEYSFTIASQVSRRFDFGRDFKHEFTRGDSRSWGFKSFMPLSELHDPNKEYLKNDNCTIFVEVSCDED